MWLRALTAITISGLLVTGCSSGDPEPEPAKKGGRISLVAEFKKARDRATSDTERAVWDRAIKDGKLQPSDYEDAFAKYRQCAQDAGIKDTYAKQANGIYKVTPALMTEKSAVDAWAKTTGGCADSTGLMRLEALYRTQVDNPEGIADQRELVVSCLLKEGLVTGAYTAEQFDKDARAGMVDTPFDTTDPKARACLEKGGYAMGGGKPEGDDAKPGSGPGN
ncbi:hypothetical protein GCM10027589_03880 [Actinocorallia lasiicapitis]